MFSILLVVMMGGSEMLVLPAPEYTDASIEECMEQRRSVRGYKDKELSLQQLSNVLWAAQGITEDRYEFRTVPSAGATYPLEIFIAKKDGLYRYVPQSHGLKQESDKDLRQAIAKAALGQGFIAGAGAVIVITAIFDRTTNRYGNRGVYYIYIEDGHCAQNIHLEAVALGLGSVPIGAFRDGELSKVLKLRNEEPLYIIPVGHPR